MTELQHMKAMGFPVLLVTLLVGQICMPTSSEETGVRTELPPESESFDGSLYATCRMHPSTQLAPGTPRVYGQVLFKQTSPAGKLRVTFRLHGFPTSDPQPRAIHIHQFGDLSGSCASTSGHYNPSGINHPHHPGDFGNFVPRNGKIHYSVDSEATLFGVQSVLGRAVVIHEQEDDLGRGGDAGSLLHGNAGGRMACCVIGMSSPKQWNKFHN